MVCLVGEVPAKWPWLTPLEHFLRRKRKTDLKIETAKKELVSLSLGGEFTLCQENYCPLFRMSKTSHF